jgi:type I restriction enzyme S subunit
MSNSRESGAATLVAENSATEVASPIPSGYKQTEIGVIPEEWEVVRLGDMEI